MAACGRFSSVAACMIVIWLQLKANNCMPPRIRTSASHPPVYSPTVASMKAKPAVVCRAIQRSADILCVRIGAQFDTVCLLRSSLHAMRIQTAHRQCDLLHGVRAVCQICSPHDCGRWPNDLLDAGYFAEWNSGRL